jgi:hypothetical protein
VRLDLVERFAALERRSTALDLGGAGFPLRTRREVEVGLSGGWIWTGIPDDARESGPFGEFLMTVRPEGGTLRVTVDLAISVVRVAPVDYVEFRGFLARVDAALSRRTLAVRRFPVR